MELKLDTSKKYALALGGGGAKGGYEVGAWAAFEEAGIRFSAVSGTSVGALNGAMVAMGDVNAGKSVWENIRYSQVMDVDDALMDKLLHGAFKELDLRATADMVKDIFSRGGIDVKPLYDWMKSVVDEECVRRSDTELFIVTYSIRAKKELELRAKDLPDGMLCDMLLASAYLPVFHSEKLEGKFADGGVKDVLPLHVLFEHGYRDILAVHVHGFGRERRVRIPEDAKVYTVAPTADLGSTLEFTAEQSRFNLRAGYFDAMKLLYGLKGRKWYLDAQWDEKAAYDYLCGGISHFLTTSGKNFTMRELHEKYIPAAAKVLEVKSPDYRDVLLAYLEEAARETGLEQFQVYSEDGLVQRLGSTACPEKVCRSFDAPKGLKKIATIFD